MPLPEASARRLLDIARASIRHGFSHGQPLALSIEREAPDLQPLRATFVTLQSHGALRGCIGTLEARTPLAQDVADHAYAAAFEDSRFDPLDEHELPQIEIHISILSPPSPLPCRDETELLGRLRPGIDGLILHEGRQRATFLPSVWEDLRSPREFLAHLKMKAGLPADYWSSAIRFERYEAEKVSE